MAERNQTISGERFEPLEVYRKLESVSLAITGLENRVSPIMSVSAASPPSGVRSTPLGLVAQSRTALRPASCARRMEEIAHPCAVSRQQHRPQQKAARRERIGQIAHLKRHVGQTVQEQDAPLRAAPLRERPSSAAHTLERHHGGKFHPRPRRLHVHLMAYERFAGLSDIVIVVAVPGGIKRQALPRRP